MALACGSSPTVSTLQMLGPWDEGLTTEHWNVARPEVCGVGPTGTSRLLALVFHRPWTYLRVVGGILI
jgi:hypothetical protein